MRIVNANASEIRRRVFHLLTIAATIPNTFSNLAHSLALITTSHRQVVSSAGLAEVNGGRLRTRTADPLRVKQVL